MLSGRALCASPEKAEKISNLVVVALSNQPHSFIEGTSGPKRGASVPETRNKMQEEEEIGQSLCNSSERIYIGGYEPSLLSAKEILDRIVECLGDKLDIVSDLPGDINPEQKYMHINLVSRSDEPAKDAVIKLLNNVKWKGCKLKVEEAKPHFLERLRGEIQRREVSRRNEGGHENLDTAIYSLPRHLRIREKFGQEAKKIDTKPVHVDDWSVFQKMRNKLVRRQALRAVHFRFETTEIDTPMLVDEISDDESSSSKSSADSISTSSSGEGGPKGRYVWSDEDSSEENNSHTVTSNSESNELASEEDQSSESEDALIEETGGEVGAEDLAQDVESNLNILSQLFPDMKNLKPKDINRETPIGDTPKVAGRMVRFDPTKESDEKFIVKESTETQEEIERSHSDFPESLEEDHSKDNVYEQDKLEKVFRDARETEPSHKSNEPGSFSFGFQVGSSVAASQEQQPRPSTNPAQSEFHFDFQSSNDVNDTTLELESPMQVNIESSEPSRSMIFEEAELLKYMEGFYSMNDGQRIMEDVDSWRKDEKVKEEWNKKRKFLTDDWKRKRKRAVARRQRRFE